MTLGHAQHESPDGWYFVQKVYSVSLLIVIQDFKRVIVQKNEERDKPKFA